MQKTFKRLLVILLAIVATVCVSVSLTACNNTETATDYKVTVVYPDGKAVDGTADGKAKYDAEDKSVEVQICVVLASGETGTCYSKMKLDANGKATLSAPDYTLKSGEKFKLQVNNVPEGYKCDEARIYYSSANYVTEPGNYVITLVAE